MKGRESGMPPQDIWEEFFDPAGTLDVMGLKGTADAVEFGCGYGTFTIPAARIVTGTVFAIDIEPEMTAATERKANEQGLRNVTTIQRDFMTEGTGLDDNTVDYAVLFNILHINDPAVMLKEAWRILRKGGKIGIVHWNYDPSTPRGPSMDIRPRPSDCIRWAKDAGFSRAEEYDLKPYHYGIVMKKEL